MSEIRVTGIRLLCPDPVETAAFYAAAFGCDFHVASDTVVLGFGRARVELKPTEMARSTPAPANATSFQHFAVVVADMEAAYAHLCAVPGWTAISRAGPERLPASSGGVTAFKFRDPDGHPLELLMFPQGGTPHAWKKRVGLTQGIDHTAITIADTERSIAFYAGFGFTVASRGLNRGAEQERMDDTQSPLVEVTALLPPGGAPPHVELLCYRQPGTISSPVSKDDVLATRIILSESRPDLSMDVDHLDPDGHRLIIS
jgi:catechol 2,3-dioxygenase-like lactoylglutathione lyase family enzyme